MIAAAERSGRTLVVCCVVLRRCGTPVESRCAAAGIALMLRANGSVRSARHGREEVILSGIQGVAENRSDRQIRRKLYFLWK